MLRYFYLLCLLVCIEWCFCYEYISDHRPVRQRAREMKVKRQRRNGRVRKTYEVEDKDSLAHIDVASFIQQPDYDAAMTNYYKPKDSDRKSNEPNYDNIIALGSINGMSMHLPQMDEQQRRENIGNKRKLARQGDTTTDEKKFKAPVDKRANSHEKKCSIKNMKFPFFSRKKTVTPKSKKTKKKKTSFTTTNPVLQTSSAKPTGIQYFGNNDNIMKRSYEETYCPLCKRKLAVKRGNSRAKKKNKMIHNSRQFYQNAEEGAKAVPDEGIQNEVTVRKTSDAERQGSKRRKRNEKHEDKDRQLKELEEIQRKVDSMDTNGPLLAPDSHKASSVPKDNKNEIVEMR